MEYTDTLIVELPDELESRSRIFEICASVAQEDYEPDVEQDQRYTMLWWD